MLRPTHVLRALLLPLAFAGCGSDTTFSETRTYTGRERRVDWNAEPRVRLQLPDMGFTGDLPQGWEELEARPEAFKDALFRVQGTDTECYLTASVGGGTRGNIERWAQQFSLAVPASAQLPLSYSLLGKPAKLVELKGTFKGKPDQMLLGLITEGEHVATFKFTGPSAVVAKEKDHFLALAKSLRSGVGGAASPSPGGDANGFVADVPAGWQQLPKQPPFRDAPFAVPGGDTECYLTASVGGGVEGNVARWAGQFATTPPNVASLNADYRLLGKPAKLIELAGTYKGKPDQMLLGLITEGDEVSTFKFTGPKATATCTALREGSSRRRSPRVGRRRPARARSCTTRSARTARCTCRCSAATSARSSTSGAAR
jgi:hypothetical protein